MRTSLLAIFILLSFVIYSQSYEYTYNSDSSAIGYYSKILSNGDIVLLSNNFKNIPDANSLANQGPYSYGTGLIRISNNGDIIWKKSYSTNTITGIYLQELAGLVPTKKFLIKNDSSLMLPFNTYFYLTECSDDTIPPIGIYPTSYPAIYDIDLRNGSTSILKILNEDSLCGYNNLFLINSEAENTYLNISINSITKKSYLERRDSNYNRIIIDTINHTFNYKNLSTRAFNQTLFSQKNNIFSESLNHIIEYDSLGNKLDSIVKQFNAGVFTLNDDWIITLANEYNPNNTTINSFDINTSTWYQHYFSNLTITDAKIKNNQLYFIANNKESSFVYTSNLDLSDIYFKKISNNKDVKIYNIQIDELDSYFIVVGNKDSTYMDIRYPSKIFVNKGYINTIKTKYTNINELKDKISVFPNPANTILNIKEKTQMNGVKIYNTLSKQVFYKKINDYDIQIDVSDFPNGIYFIEITTNKGKKIEKIMIK